MGDDHGTTKRAPKANGGGERTGFNGPGRLSQGN
jgi:hypothetical protein